VDPSHIERSRLVPIFRSLSGTETALWAPRLPERGDARVDLCIVAPSASERAAGDGASAVRALRRAAAGPRRSGGVARRRAAWRPVIEPRDFRAPSVAPVSARLALDFHPLENRETVLLQARCLACGVGYRKIEATILCEEEPPSLSFLLHYEEGLKSSSA